MLTCIAATVDRRSLVWSSNARSCAAALASSSTEVLVPSSCRKEIVLDHMPRENENGASRFQ